MSKETLMLIENPWLGESMRRYRNRGRNPIGFDEFGNPISLTGFSNPRRRSMRRKRRNPVTALAMPSTWKEWTQGVDLMDAGAAVAGLYLSSAIPSAVVKTTDTTGQKLLRLAASFGSAVGAGAIGRAMISPGAGKAAIIGGMAGMVAQAFALFTNIQIGKPGVSRRRIGITEMVSPGTSGEEQAGLLQP